MTSTAISRRAAPMRAVELGEKVVGVTDRAPVAGDVAAVSVLVRISEPCDEHSRRSRLQAPQRNPCSTHIWPVVAPPGIAGEPRALFERRAQLRVLLRCVGQRRARACGEDDRPSEHAQPRGWTCPTTRHRHVGISIDGRADLVGHRHAIDGRTGLVRTPGGFAGESLQVARQRDDARTALTYIVSAPGPPSAARARPPTGAGSAGSARSPAPSRRSPRRRCLRQRTPSIVTSTTRDGNDSGVGSRIGPSITSAATDALAIGVSLFGSPLPVISKGRRRKQATLPSAQRHGPPTTRASTRPLCPGHWARQSSAPGRGFRLPSATRQDREAARAGAIAPPITCELRFALRTAARRGVREPPKWTR